MSNLASAIRLPHVFRPYYYGPHKWENYLIDIQEAISAEQYPLPEELTAGIEGLRAGIEDLRAEFEWGFTLMIDRMERQINVLNRIVGQLDAIRHAVQLPSTTRARELFALGQRDQQKGLLPEALEKFLAAERENKVNFPLQLQIGKLFLYGKDRDNTLIDLPKAEQHMLLAARYAGVERGYEKYQGEALFHAAIAAYLIGKDEKAVGHVDGMRSCLERALTSLTCAVRSWPKFSEIVYLQAKCHALLGQEQAALEKLKDLSDRDRRYFAKMSQDKDFDAIRVDAETVFRQAIAEPGPAALNALAKLRDAEEELAKAQNTEPKSKEDHECIASTRTRLVEIRKSLQGLEADIEGIPPRLDAAKTDVERVFRCDIVDCDEYGLHGGQLVEHQKFGQMRLKLADGELYANGVRIVLYRSQKQLAGGSIRWSKLQKELRCKPVLNSCICDYLEKHPHLIPRGWSGLQVHFWGTIVNSNGIVWVPFLSRIAALNYKWSFGGNPSDHDLESTDVAAILES